MNEDKTHNIGPMPPMKSFQEFVEYSEKQWKTMMQRHKQLEEEMWKDFEKNDEELEKKAEESLGAMKQEDVAKMDGEELVVNDHKEFFHYGKNSESLRSVPVIAELFDFMIKIENACGCVRQQLHERAANMYRQTLPLLEAKNRPELEKWKQEINKSKILLKDQGHVLIQV